MLPRASFGRLQTIFFRPSREQNDAEHCWPIAKNISWLTSSNNVIIIKIKCSILALKQLKFYKI